MKKNIPIWVTITVLIASSAGSFAVVIDDTNENTEDIREIKKVINTIDVIESKQETMQKSIEEVHSDIKKLLEK